MTRVPPNQALQQTGHAKNASSSYSVFSRVSRLLSGSFGDGEGARLGELTEDIVERGSGLLRVKLPEVGGEYELTCSPSLVQAVGSCAGVDFYFRAKYEEWEFETEDERGHPFPDSDARRFIRRDCYDAAKTGAMGVEWAARILRRCLAEWWNLRAEPIAAADRGRD